MGNGKEQSRGQTMESNSRRRLLKQIGTASVVTGAAAMLPPKWAKPVVDRVLVPAHAQTSPPPSPPSCTVYEIGDTGPGGGLVFYTSNGGCSGLEAAPADQSASASWGCSGTDVSGAGGQGIGDGAANTAAILSAGCTSNDAADLASTYGGGGFSDWFLPSSDELNEMYTQLHQNGLGGFADYYYWSSSQDDADNAWLQNFRDGLRFQIDKVWSFPRVRAVRAF